MQYARVHAGIVREIINLPDTTQKLVVGEDGAALLDESGNYQYTEEPTDIHEIFSPEMAAQMVLCLDEAVGEGWTYADGTFTAPPPPEPAEPVIVSIPANVFFQRTTDEEAEAIDEAMMTKTLRIRRQWQDPAVLFRSDGELWTHLRGVLVELYGEDRAAELLAA